MEAEWAPALVASIFFVGAIASVVSFRLSKFRLYLLLGLSTLLRGVGFAARAAMTDDPTNKDLAAVSLVFRQAGYGISIAVLCILMGCWFKNADERARPAHNMRWSIGVRLLIAPVIVFGPIIGIAAAVLIYGNGSPSALDTADDLRHGSSWTFMAVVSIQSAMAAYAAFLVIRWQWHLAEQQQQQQQNGLMKRASSLRRVASTLRHASSDARSWVHILQLQCAFLNVSTIFRVVSLYHPQFSLNPDLFYTLQVLPELLYVVALLVPGVMVRVGMAARYPDWVAALQEGRPYSAVTQQQLGSSHGGSGASEGTGSACEALGKPGATVKEQTVIAMV